MKATPPPDPTPPPSGPPPEPAAPPPESAPAAALGPPEPATWPDWFAAVDIALALIVLALAFLVTSFAARNSDVWLHLAAGRNVTHGNLGMGADPFSFAGGDRPWVHSSWLFDLALYALYSIDTTGAIAVGAKAACVAAAFGLLFLLRRTGYALWPWAVCGLLGAVAAAPYAQLRPISVSMLFLAATFVLLYRRPWSPTGWRDPAYLIGLFWLWGNSDAWALLGPVTAAVVLVGEYLNRFLAKDEEADPADPFPPAPPLPALGRAVALGFIAVLLNPTFVAAVVKDPLEAVTQFLPPELGVDIPREVADDIELSILVRSPLESDYQSQTNLGKNVNGVAFAALLAGGAAVLLAGFGRLRVTHLLLWLLFAGLALVHVRLIAFFAVVAVPLVAGHLNGLSALVRLGPLAQPGTRIVLTASGMGRLLTVLAGLAAVGATYPGWIHPQQTDAAYATRLDWAVTADPGIVRAAERLNGWRADGTLPDAVRGLNTSADFGNYCAWFAPREKAFVNGRFAYHRHDLPDFLALRRQAADRRTAWEAPPDAAEVWRVCEARSADYLVSSALGRRVFELGVITLLEAEDRWIPWHLGGRAVILGRVSDRGSAATATRLRFDPAAEAFAPGRPLLPDGKTTALPPPKESLLDEYTDRPKPVGPWTDDAILLFNYNSLVVARRAQQDWQRKIGTTQFGAAALGGCPVLPFVGAQSIRRNVDEAELAIPVLAVRAARRAVGENPDRPEAYRALALVYQERFTPVNDLPQLPGMGLSESQLQVMTARARFLARLPDLEKGAIPPGLRAFAFQEAFFLAQEYEQSGQLDLRLDVIRKMIDLARQVPPEEVRKFLEQTIQLPPSADPAKGFDELRGRLTREVQPQIDAIGQLSGAPQRFYTAQARGLPGLAIKMFLENPKDFGARYPDAFLQVIGLELRAGRLEDAAAHLDLMDDKIKEEEREGKKFPPEFLAIVRQLKGLKHRLEGNYEALVESMNDTAPPRADAAAARAAADLGAVIDTAVMVAGPVAMLSGGMFDRRTAPPPMMPVDALAGTRNLLGYESAYQYDRAMAALVRGDVSEAKRRLEAARSPQGIDLAKLGEFDRLARIELYLKMIARAESAGK